MNLIDLHNHILPYVDDGAADMEEALELLQMEAEQGVSVVCVTPHLRRKMFESTDARVQEMFARLRTEAAQIPIELHLSREYYFDSNFEKLLEAQSLLSMGSQRVVLTEFSYRSSAETLLEASRMITQARYQPLFAHVECYEAVQNDPELVRKLVDSGTMIQMNANAALGLEGWKKKFLCRRLLKQKLVHVIASDAHDPENRTTNLRKCAVYLEKKIGREYTQQLMWENPLQILK